MDITEKIDMVLNEAVDADIAKIVKIIKSGVEMMGMRTHLEGVFPKKAIDFSMSQPAHFRIKTKKGTLIIVNKKYADEAEEIVGDYAIGYEGKI
jgi:hypothetical protein